MNNIDHVDAASLNTDIPDVRRRRHRQGARQHHRGQPLACSGVPGRCDLGRHGAGVRETFTVRKISFQVGVERMFPVHSPVIEKIELVTRGDVRRAKIYYLRGLTGKKAKIQREARRLSLAPLWARTGTPGDTPVTLSGSHPTGYGSLEVLYPDFSGPPPRYAERPHT